VYSCQGYSCPVRASSSSATTDGLALANVTTVGFLVLDNMSADGPYSEDCLNLNIWTKPQSGDAKKAVLIWIYGGGFSSGTSAIPAYNGANIAGQEDVVVVSIKLVPLLSTFWPNIDQLITATA